MKMVGGIPGPSGRFEKGGKSYGGPGRRHGACMVRNDRPLTDGETQQRYTAKHPERVKARKQKWRVNNPEAYKAEKRRRHLKVYGLTPETYEAMWVAQDRKCASCRSTDSSSKKGWQVDHCHKTGRARGILCTHCNRMVAGALDDPERLLRGIAYLQAIDATNDSA